MQIKTTMRYHLTPVRMAIIKKFTNKKWWRGCGEQETLLHFWWKCKLEQPLWRTVWRFLKKLGIELPYDPATPLPGIHTKKTRTERDTCSPVFIAAAAAAAASKLLQSCPTLWPHRRQPTRLLHPWDSQGKNTGVGCHFLLQCMTVKSESEVPQSCLTLSDPMDCSLPGSSVHGIFQATVLEWGAIAFYCSTIYNS